MSYPPPQPPYPGQQPYQDPQIYQDPMSRSAWDRPPRRRRHRVRTALLITGGIFLAFIVIAAVAGGGKQPAPAASTTASAAPVAATSTAAAKPKITYVVTGTRGGADVTYGPEGSSLSGHVPMRIAKRLGHADYYSIQAQLQGGGKVTVEIMVGGKVISKGTATGGYNIASAEIEQDMFTGKWEDVQS